MVKTVARGRTMRPLKCRGLVVTEGTVTEKQYIETLVQHLRQSSAVVSVTSVGVGKDPVEVVKKCIERRDDATRRKKGFDWCVCLVDRDEHTTLAKAAGLAADENIHLLVSNLKFEIWLLWHAVDTRSPKNSVELDRLMDKHKLLENKHIPLRFPIAKFRSAAEIATRADPGMAAGRVGPDPSSALPLLVEMMIGEL